MITLSEALPLAISAKRAGQSTIRLEVEPRPRFMQSRHFVLWGSAIAKVVGRRAVTVPGVSEMPQFEAERLIVEVSVIDVIEAHRAAMFAPNAPVGSSAGTAR